LESFKDLAKTGCVEFLSETYYHSLSFLYSKEEFKRQVEMHREKIKEHFGQSPKVFRNTELIYSNEVASFIEKMGYKAILCEGVDRLLGKRTPNYLYQAATTLKIKSFLKNYSLSDDIAFRFSDRNWTEWPLHADTFAKWVHKIAGDGEVLNLFMDYETFGEHQWDETGIFDFLDHLPKEILKHPDFDFKTISEAADSLRVRDIYDAPDFTSWADAERDLSAWLSNPMELESARRLYALEEKVKAIGNKDLIDVWGKLQTSDHFYYMCTKFWADGDVHKYFSPYDSPYDAYIYYMNILADFESTIEEAYKDFKSVKKVTKKKETV
jgi:alpha-amylase